MKIRSKSECRWDQLSLGEVMLRLDPGFSRISTARSFQVWEGGGEYNVARGLKRCFDLDSAVVTAFADNAVGRLLQDLIYQGGVDQSLVLWLSYDGVGRQIRNGLNFTERGFGVRGALGCSDRGNTAMAHLKPRDIDWEKIFGYEGVRWLHTGGIYAAVSENSPLVIKEAMKVAKRYGTVISYDLNYRESLWKGIGGKKKAQQVNREIAPYVDVMLGNEEDFISSLGFTVDNTDENFSKLDVTNFKRMIKQVVHTFPNFKVVATTLRNAKTATSNDWGAICYSEGEFYQAVFREDLEILDRVGGGDSFASGLIYGFLMDKGAKWAVDCGAAHGALAMTTPGDTSMVTISEVEKVMKGSSARVSR